MSKNFIIGIDLGGTNLKIALLDLRAKIIRKDLLNTRNFTSKDKLIRAIVNSVEKIIKEKKIQKSQVLGLGLGLPGLVDIELGLVHFLPNIPGFKNVNLRQILEKEIGLPVFIDNDANLMCLAEFKLGSAKGAKNAVCLTLGTGVGGGIIINRQLYRGTAFAAGEIGHMPVNEIGPRCNCAGLACLEAYIGNTRILSAAKKVFKRPVPLEELSRLASTGNQPATRLWEDVGLHLGVVLTGVINLLNPDCVVIGGGVAKAGKILFDKINLVVRKRAMPVQAKAVKIVPAMLGSDAGMIGAGLLVREGLL